MNAGAFFFMTSLRFLSGCGTKAPVGWGGVRGKRDLKEMQKRRRGQLGEDSNGERSERGKVSRPRLKCGKALGRAEF